MRTSSNFDWQVPRNLINKPLPTPPSSSLHSLILFITVKALRTRRGGKERKKENLTPLFLLPRKIVFPPSPRGPYFFSNFKFPKYIQDMDTSIGLIKLVLFRGGKRGRIGGGRATIFCSFFLFFFISCLNYVNWNGCKVKQKKPVVGGSIKIVLGIYY